MGSALPFATLTASANREVPSGRAKAPRENSSTPGPRVEARRLKPVNRLLCRESPTRPQVSLLWLLT